LFITNRSFSSDDYAISEAFNAVPAITIVVFGLTLFSIILFSTYDANSQTIERLHAIEIAEYYSEKITNPQQGLANYDGSISLLALENEKTLLLFSELNSTCAQKGFDYALKLSFEDTCIYIPKNITIKPDNHYAVTKQVVLKINDVQVKPATFSLILWEV